MPKRKRSSDYCHADAKRKKERRPIAAETSNERRARLSAVRLRRRKRSTLYRAAFSYDCNYDYVIIISGTNLHCSHLTALSASGASECAASEYIMCTVYIANLPLSIKRGYKILWR